MKVSISALFLAAIATLGNALVLPEIDQKIDTSVERQLSNRNAHVVLQEPIERAQARADKYAMKVKRGEYQLPHHPKYRPTGTVLPTLETHAWDTLALIKTRMQHDSHLVLQQQREEAQS